MSNCLRVGLAEQLDADVAALQEHKMAPADGQLDLICLIVNDETGVKLGISANYWAHSVSNFLKELPTGKGSGQSFSSSLSGATMLIFSELERSEEDS